MRSFSPAFSVSLWIASASLVWRFQGANSQQYPFFVLVEDLDSGKQNKYCSGVLIHTDLILSDTSCEGYWENGLAKIGIADMNRPADILDFVNVESEIKNITDLPPETLLVKLARPTDPAHVATLASTRPVAVSSLITKLGFATAIDPPIKSTTLQTQNLNVQTLTTCRSLVAPYYNIDASTIVTNDMLCADAPIDNCYDDLGGFVVNATGQQELVGFAQQDFSVCRDLYVPPSTTRAAPTQILPTLYRDVSVYRPALQAAICLHSNELTNIDYDCVPSTSPTEMPSAAPVTPAPTQAPTASPTVPKPPGIIPALIRFLNSISALVRFLYSVLGKR